MIDQTTISPTTSVNGEVKPSPVQEIRIDEQQQLVPEEARDMIEMLEQANEELRVLMEDDGLEEVEIITELKNQSVSSDEWDDDDDDDDDPSTNSSASHHVDKIEEIVGDVKPDDDEYDNESTDEWHDEQKITFEKVMDFIAFPEKHLFPPEEEGIEVDKELGVVNSDSEYGDEETKEEEKKEQKENDLLVDSSDSEYGDAEQTGDEEKEEVKDAGVVGTTEETKPIVSTPSLTVETDTPLEESNGEVETLSPPGESSPSESTFAEEEATKTPVEPDHEPSVEVILPANHGAKEKSPLTPLASPRQWLSNFFQFGDRVTVTVKKESKNQPLGVFIKKVLLKDGLYISQLQEGSAIASTDLKPGMKILTINGNPCPQTVKDFREMVSTMEGQVTIVAQPPEDENEGLVVVTIFKESKTQPLGLVLRRQMFREGLVVAKVLEGSIFRNTELKEGMRIVRVNDQPCPPTVDAFRNLCHEIDGQVKILAEPTVAQSKHSDENKEMEEEEQRDEPEEKREDSILSTEDEGTEVPPMPKIFRHRGIERKEVVCKIVKGGTHEPLGLLLREFKDEEGIHVLQLDENSKLGATALKPGMTIHQINGQNCPNKVDECIKVLRSIKGQLTIVASEIYED